MRCDWRCLTWRPLFMKSLPTGWRVWQAHGLLRNVGCGAQLTWTISKGWDPIWISLIFLFTFYSQYLIFYRCYFNAPAFLSYGRQRPPAALSEARSHWWRKYWASCLGPNNMGPGRGLGLRQTRVVTFKFSFWILKIWTERKIEKLKCKFDEKSKTKYEK